MKNNDRDLMIRNQGGDFDLFDNLIDDFFDMQFNRHEFRQLEKAMKTDIKEHEKSYELEIEMPGFNKKDIHLSLNNGYLTVSASKHENNDEKNSKGEYIRRERRYGSCSRSFYVGDIKEEEINASLNDGILSISLPKEVKEEPKKKYIEIK